MLRTSGNSKSAPELWDGMTSDRIVSILLNSTTDDHSPVAIDFLKRGYITQWLTLHCA